MLINSEKGNVALENAKDCIVIYANGCIIIY